MRFTDYLGCKINHSNLIPIILIKIKEATEKMSDCLYYSLENYLLNLHKLAHSPFFISISLPANVINSTAQIFHRDILVFC